MAPKTAERLAAVAATNAAPRKESEEKVAPIASDPLRQLAQALGESPEELRERYATYATPSIGIAGRSCPSDLQWTRIRESDTLPDDVTLRAHLRSCIRCVPRAIAWFGPTRWRLLRQEEFAAELLCLEIEMLVQSVERPESIPLWAAQHLENCATCSDDREASEGPELSRDVAQRLMNVADSLRHFTEAV